MTRRFALPLLALLAAVLLALAPPRVVHGDLIADLSEHLVAITTGFVGTDVLLFGSIEAPGNVVVVVTGPRSTKVVRRKERVAGIWINREQLTFGNVPGFYSLASSGPVDEITPETVRSRLEIGPENLRLTVPEDTNQTIAAQFKTALIRSKVDDELYSRVPASIQFLGHRLFRTDIRVPANAPTGLYTVAVYLLRDGDVVSAEIQPLTVGKAGFEAQIYLLAHEHSLVYGVLAILIAGVAGWIANVVFRKG